MIGSDFKSNNLMGKKASKESGLVGILAILLIIVLIILIVAYFIFANLTSEALTKINTINQDISVTITDQHRWEEGELIKYKTKSEIFAGLLRDHKLSTRVLDFLERSIMAKIQISALKGGMSSDSGDIITVNGEAPGFLMVGQQYKIFEADQDVSEVVVSAVSLNEKGKVNFIFNIVLNPNVTNFTQL